MATRAVAIVLRLGGPCRGVSAAIPILPGMRGSVAMLNLASIIPGSAFLPGGALLMAARLLTLVIGVPLLVSRAGIMTSCIPGRRGIHPCP
ncbi:hypothetical protein GCM10019059_09840 [Camelimonas fluminis]|nr:hypothetical protein GCM10019059_09840 [Camelimonas fluminis]